MHGLIPKAIQSFFVTTYGAERWNRVIGGAGLSFAEFEPMLRYEQAQCDGVLDAIESEFGRSIPEFLEDLGTFLVSDPQLESLRRLLRFGGVTYEDFLHSLDDLPARTRLAVSDLELPLLELRETGPNAFSLTCGSGLPGFGHVMVGVLRALADDYGALVMLECSKSPDGCDEIGITLIESSFAAGRSFDLGVRSC